ncbi:hypothetical protein [Neisseria animaloris]|uniref:hypothetical protein n=1 Tax=Neisseria animaloris TaxID=326522 RepID=UPI000D36C0F6|nr:hypothetical protein [Neisseria animaloris]
MDTKILEIFIKHIESGNYQIAIIIFASLIIITVTLKFKDFVEYLSNRQNFRRKLLEETVDKIQRPKVKNFLEDELLREYFVRVFKFNAEIIFIEKLIDFHIFLNGEFTFNQLMKSSKYMKISEGRLIINLTCSDSFADKWLYRIIAWIFMLLFILLLLLFLWNLWQNNWEGFIFICFACFAFLLSLIVRTQAFPYENAEKLKIKLNTLNQE